MKTDTIFYRLFQSFTSILFELINQPPEAANTYQFSSVEVKQLSFRIDGVFLPASNAPSPPIYFVEVQFQPDPKFYSRLFTEIFLYLDKTQLIPFRSIHATNLALAPPFLRGGHGVPSGELGVPFGD